LGSVSSLVSEKKIFEISANQRILLALAAILNIRLETKNSYFVEDHPRNIPAKFGSNRPSGFGEEA
jgi:cobalamin biosynthesis protein CobD/CbiB